MNMNAGASAHPTLISFLLHQTQTEQVPFAERLKTSQARVSRISRGNGTLSDDEWEASAKLLALGRPESGSSPVWVVTRFHASGFVEAPPPDRDGEVAVFRHYRVARAVVAYLREVAGIRQAYAVPAWMSFVRDQMEAQGHAPRIKEFGAEGGADEVAAAVTDWLPSAVRGFAVQAPPVAQ